MERYAPTKAELLLATEKAKDHIKNWGGPSDTFSTYLTAFVAGIEYVKATPSPAKAEQELRPIKPLGDWLLAQKDLPPVMLPDGGYWYYGSVLQLLKRYKSDPESTTPPVKEAGQPRNLPIEELIKLSDEELTDEIEKIRSRLGMGRPEQAPVPQPADIKEVTGFDTMAEYQAYTKGREDEQSVFLKFIEEWDGATNSAAGALLAGKLRPYLQPVDGPWKPGCVVEPPHPESGCVSEVNTWITDGVTTIHIDDWNADEIEDGEVRLASFLNKYEYKLSIDRSSEHVAAHYESKFKEANQFIIDLAKAFGQEGIGYDDLKWSVEDFQNAVKEQAVDPVAFARWDCERCGGDMDHMPDYEYVLKLYTQSLTNAKT